MNPNHPQGPPPPHHYPTHQVIHQQQHHEHDGSKKFMNMGIGTLMIVLAVCLGAPVLFCVFTLVLGVINSGVQR